MLNRYEFRLDLKWLAEYLQNNIILNIREREKSTS